MKNQCKFPVEILRKPGWRPCSPPTRDGTCSKAHILIDAPGPLPAVGLPPGNSRIFFNIQAENSTMRPDALSARSAGRSATECNTWSAPAARKSWSMADRRAANSDGGNASVSASVNPRLFPERLIATVWQPAALPAAIPIGVSSTTSKWRMG